MESSLNNWLGTENGMRSIARAGLGFMAVFFALEEI